MCGEVCQLGGSFGGGSDSFGVNSALNEFGLVALLTAKGSLKAAKPWSKLHQTYGLPFLASAVRLPLNSFAPPIHHQLLRRTLIRILFLILFVE